MCHTFPSAGQLNILNRPLPPSLPIYLSLPKGDGEAVRRHWLCCCVRKLPKTSVRYRIYSGGITYDIRWPTTNNKCSFVQNLKSPKVLHRLLCNFDTTLHSNTCVFLYTYCGILAKRQKYLRKYVCSSVTV
jgi:hypothetical protein